MGIFGENIQRRWNGISWMDGSECDDLVYSMEKGRVSILRTKILFRISKSAKSQKV